MCTSWAACAYRTIKEYRAVDFHAAADTVALPFPSLEELEKELAAAEDPDSLRSSLRRVYDTQVSRAEFLRAGKEPEKAYTFVQIILALNDEAFVPFPFEMFSEITLRLRDYSPFTHTLSTSNTNDKRSYLPSGDQVCRGGYEVRMFTGCDLFALEENTDDHIIQENLRILRKLPTAE